MFQRQFLPNLNLLKAFEAAGRHTSFKLAAEELFVTPSAISQQVKTLEEQLGVRLFIRKNRALELSPAGKAYWLNIHEVLSQVHQHTMSLINTYQKELKVSIMPPVASRIVLPNLASFHEENPSIDLRLDATLKYSDIKKGEADVAIRFGVPPWEGLHHEKLSDIYIQIVCPPGFSRKYKLLDNFKRLVDVPLIHMSERPGAWQKVFDELNLGESTSKQIYLDDYPSAMDAAETLGAMLALMPVESLLIDSGRLEAPFPQLGPLDEGIYAVYDADNPQLNEINCFVGWLQALFQQLTESV